MQQSEPPSRPARRRRAYVSILGTTQMHLRSPMIIALWSAIFPGLGHLLLSKYVSGMILFMWEVLINLKSHLNLSIYYTFTADFEMAKAVLDKRWLMLYIPTYLFAIWDSYRSTVDMNNHFVLAAREDAEIQPFVIHPFGFNYVDKSSPLVAVIWSAITPGAGQLIIHRIVVAYFLLILWVVVVYMSKALPAVYHTALGQFDLAKELVDKQWMLNIPSILFFSIYDAYTNTVESNKLYEWEQSKFLKREYQDVRFPMPFRPGQERTRMYVVSNFEHSIGLESAITELQMRGIPKKDILAVPLDKQGEDRLLFDRTHASDGRSTLDFPIISAALCSLFGIIYGFALRWGPILWALIGTGVGFGVGVLIKLLVSRKRREKLRAELPEVVLMVACTDAQLDAVRDMLWKNGALGVSRLSLDGGA
ncbi:MAG: hypothetical protein GX592_05195 [Clostridiales bacterium]|nr:hypothetical protein [Clostridiales bacterium]